MNNEHRKAEIITELKELLKLHNDIKDYILKLKKLVSANPTINNKKELEDYIKQERDYITLINEYLEELQSIGVINNIEETKNYFKILDNFNDICEKIQKIEKLSKKAKKSNNNFIMTVNSDGRKKEILSNLVEEYNLLVNQKKFLTKSQQEAYNYFKRFDISPSSEKENGHNDNNINNTKDSSEDIKTLEQVSDETNKIISKDIQNNVDSNKDKQEQIDIIDDDYDDLMSYIQDEEVDYSNNDSRINQFNFKNITNRVSLFATGLKNKFHSKVPGVKNLRTSKKEFNKNLFKVTAISLVGVVLVSSIVPNIISKHNTKIFRKGYDSNSFDIVNTTSSDTNDDRTNQKNQDTESDISNKLEEQQQKQQEHQDEQSEQKEDQQEQVDASIKSNYNITFGDIIKINSNSKIYNNMYDASSKENGFNPYFGFDKERYIGGLSLNYNGKMIFLQYNEDNVYEKLKTLIEDGAKIENVCTINDNGYEGFYNIDDISLIDIVYNEINNKKMK